MNVAAPQRIKEGSTRPVWSEDTWLQKHAGETLPGNKTGPGGDEGGEAKDETTTTSNVSCYIELRYLV